MLYNFMRLSIIIIFFLYATIKAAWGGENADPEFSQRLQVFLNEQTYVKLPEYLNEFQEGMKIPGLTTGSAFFPVSSGSSFNVTLGEYSALQELYDTLEEITSDLVTRGMLPGPYDGYSSPRR